MLKFTNKSGYSLGSCVVCISGLLSQDKNQTYSSMLSQVGVFCFFTINLLNLFQFF